MNQHEAAAHLGPVPALPTKNIENNPMQSSVADAGRGQHPHFDTLVSGRCRSKESF